MLVTNDVALITFVPLAIETLEYADKKNKILPVVVMQTVAANLGSMLTPVGNPQNLYLYDLMKISFGGFIMKMVPLTAVSAVIIILITILWLRDGNVPGPELIGMIDEPDIKDSMSLEADTMSLCLADGKYVGAFRKGEKTSFQTGIRTDMSGMSSSDDRHRGGSTNSAFMMAVYFALFILNLTVVLNLIPYYAVLAVTVAAVLLMDSRQLLKVDYSLLVTFICFFIFVGNMGRIDTLAGLLQRLISGRELELSVILSQFISNVPAALLLSGFTSNYTALLYGVDIGGLGTLIASMASLISYKYIAGKKDIGTGSYLAAFTVVNCLILIVLYSFTVMFLV
jgi:Na+/H+ antiporter NhaD/arsenite permease-like protein